MLLNVKLETVPALLASATADLIPVNAIDQLSGCPFTDSVPTTPKKTESKEEMLFAQNKVGERKVDTSVVIALNWPGLFTAP